MAASVFILSCSQGNTTDTTTRPQTAPEGGGDVQPDSGQPDSPGSESPEAALPDAETESAAFKGIRGTVKVLDGQPKGFVIVTRPGSQKKSAQVPIENDGSFRVPGLEPGTYRVILPAEGFHATSEMYAKIPPDAEIAEINIPRSKGCPVEITVRDHTKAPVKGAVLELLLTDLPQVDERHKTQGTTNEEGIVTFLGSCVRGYLKGTLKLSSTEDSVFKIYHGYMGTGRDHFDIVLPEKSGAKVSYANDD